MPKSRPATWLEKEMMLNLIKKSGKNLTLTWINVIIFAVRPGILSVCLKTSRCST